MAFGHMAGGTRATSTDKDLQSYYHTTSPLMHPITAYITTAPPSPRRNRASITLNKVSYGTGFRRKEARHKRQGNDDQKI